MESDYDDFIRLYNHAETLTLKADQFTPNMLDLFNINRSHTSIVGDKRLRNKLDKRVNKSLLFNSTNIPYNYSGFIDALIEEKQYIIDDTHYSKVALSQSEQYQKCLTLFLPFNNNSVQSEYEDEQKDTYNELHKKKILLF